MLQYSTVDQGTLELLKSLMQQPFLSDYNLVGGTALALQLGHRKSIDLDFFTSMDIDTIILENQLEQIYKISDVASNKNGLSLFIEYPEKSNNMVKVDFVKYQYGLLRKLIVIDGIRLLSIEDIIPMKLSAAANRGTKKDFFDLYFLLQVYSLKEMMKLFEQKFSNYNNFYIVKSLTYFDDAENDIDPVLMTPCSWSEVKDYIRLKTQEFL